jgi:hypothetical protein
VTSEGSGLSRLTLKFLEVFAAGLATAVSGYLIAHFSGYLAAVTPVAAVKQPSVIQPWVIQQSVRSGPATPVVHEAAPAAAAPQSNMADQSPSANGTGTKPRDAVETKPHEAARGPAAPSFEARVRAALAKSGPAKAGPANSGPAHPASDDAPRREAVVPVDAMPRVGNTTTQPVYPPTGSIAATPPPGDSAPRSVPVARPPAATAPAIENIAAPTPTIQLAPPSAVEIKSQPVASVDPDQPAPVAAQPPPSTDHDGPFAAITRRLHIDKLLTGGDQPPRPPMPVGQ